MHVLITGGAGFIGSNLARALVESGDAVTVLDDLSSGFTDNLTGLEGIYQLVKGDVRNYKTVHKAARGVEIIYHLAAVPSVARSVIDPLTSNSVNVQGTVNVLVAARDSSVRRIVYASSSAIYGDTPTLPRHEDLPSAPLSPYAASKAAGEAYCRAFARVYGLETISLRFFNVFGPRQNAASEYAAAIPRFITRMLGGEPPVLFGDGLQSRDFIFVDNVVQACVLAASAGPEAVGQALNIGYGKRTTLLELVGILNELLGTAVRPTFAEPRRGDVRDSEAAILKARELIGYRPLVGVREGLDKTIRWFSARMAMARPTS
jgi:UDP-glucose 4-epimerase